MKKIAILNLFIMLFFSILVGCEGIENYSTNSNFRLNFSTDTLSFDTIFSSIGSTTKQIMVYNPNNEALKIGRISLANPQNSGFRINIDGRTGESFEGIDIWKKDSLYVFVEVTVNPNGKNQPLIIEDSILFEINGIQQFVLLQAYGQDVHLIKGGVIYSEDTNLTADLPYLVYDSLTVEEGTTLTVEKGVIFYMHNKASMIVKGTVKAKGTRDEPILFRGDRMDKIQTSDPIPYDLVPGQWKGIRFLSSSFGNEFNYVIVRNGTQGLVFEESEPEQLKMNIQNSQITNMDGSLFKATNCYIEASNSEFSNAAEAAVELIGGKYQFVHCTMVSYKLLGKNRDSNTFSSVTLRNVLAETDKTDKKYYALKQAYFDNCIIDGFSKDTTKLYKGEIHFYPDSKEDEAGIDDRFNYRFNSCFIRTVENDNNRFANCLFVKSPTYIKRETNEKENDFSFDFRLANKSVGIGKADRSIAEKYPEDRYGVNRLTSSTGPSVGAYEYVYQEEKKD